MKLENIIRKEIRKGKLIIITKFIQYKIDLKVLSKEVDFLCATSVYNPVLRSNYLFLEDRLISFYNNKNQPCSCCLKRELFEIYKSVKI